MTRILRLATPAAAAFTAMILTPLGASASAAALRPASVPASTGPLIDVPGTALGLTDAGALAATALVPVDFILNEQHADELAHDIALLSAPRSPYFHRFFTNEQWNAYFAPSAATVQRVIGLLNRAGFHVTQISANRKIVSAVAPAAVVQRYLRTTLRMVDQPGLGLRYRNAVPAIIPAELAGDVMAVTGLDNLESIRIKPHPHGTPETVAQQQARLARPTPPLFGPAGVSELGPAVLASGYSYPSAGAGVTVGINIPGDTAVPSDTATYESYFGITPTGKLTIVPVNGGYHGGPQGEATLDVETIVGLAPAANINVYEAPNFSNKNIIASLNAVVSANTVSSVSNSWGEGENLVPKAILESSDSIFEQAVAKGIEFIFSSGDSGAEGDYRQNRSYKVVTDWPACDPNVTAVGGVHIDVNATTGAIISTTATWLNLRSGKGYADASGGGVSAVYGLPPYQTQVAIKSSGRNVPDVSLVGDEEDANYAKAFGGWYSQGGTSWSGPAFNAMLADIASKNGKTTGFINPTLYAAYGAGGASFVTDVTTGANGIFGQFGYPATVNFDLATGVGTPIGTALLSVL